MHGDEARLCGEAVGLSFDEPPRGADAVGGERPAARASSSSASASGLFVLLQLLEVRLIDVHGAATCARAVWAADAAGGTLLLLLLCIGVQIGV